MKGIICLLITTLLGWWSNKCIVFENAYIKNYFKELLRKRKIIVTSICHQASDHLCQHTLKEVILKLKISSDKVVKWCICYFGIYLSYLLCYPCKAIRWDYTEMWEFSYCYCWFSRAACLMDNMAPKSQWKYWQKHTNINYLLESD